MDASNVPASEGARRRATKMGEESIVNEETQISDRTEHSADTLPEKQEATPSSSDSGFLANMNPKWRNWWIRGMFSFLMITSFSILIYLGPVTLILLVQAIQIKCYQEIISVGHKKYQRHNLPWFRTLSWYFLLSLNYFMYGEIITLYFQGVLQREEAFKSFMAYHRLISFTLYCIGFILFVITLKKDFYKVQFSLFGWTHITLLTVVVQSHFIMHTIFEGLIWFFLPVTLVIINDIFAYIFGFFFGRTPLIKLSPKKTWEGFIGGGLATVLWGWIISYILSQFAFFYCPIEYDVTVNEFKMHCEPSGIFRLTPYAVPAFLQYSFKSFGVSLADVIYIYPMQVHSLALALFSSLIAPFGGFFASGFKRAFKMKDFDDIIPGHGGLMDRFDCQILMAVFVNVYYHTFIRSPNSQKLLQQIFSLSQEQQLFIYQKLQKSLKLEDMIAGQ